MDESTILNAVKVKGEPVDRDHYYFSTWNNSLHLYHLDIKPGEKAEVQILDSLRNIYGFNLAESKSFTLEGKDYPAITNPGMAEQPVRLKEGEYFVLGDNRNNSEDSRNAEIGIVSSEMIEGKVWFVLAPAEHRGFL